MSNRDPKNILEHKELVSPLIPLLGENIGLEFPFLDSGAYLDIFSQEVESPSLIEQMMAQTQAEADSTLFPVNRFPVRRPQPAIAPEFPSINLSSKQFTGADENNLIPVQPEPLEASVNEIKGTPGREVIEGTEENERIIGGFGADTISGGAGEDIFVYESLRDAGDLILDFELNQDKIDLSTVLSSIGYQGDSPLADGYVTLTGYDSGTVLNLDSDGIGEEESRAYIQVQGITPEELASNPNHICPHPEATPQLAPAISVPGVQSVMEDESLVISGIDLVDTDGSIGELEVSLSVNHGVISLGSTEGLSFTTGDGNEGNNFVFTGTLADLNTALKDLVYQSNPDFNGEDDLVIIVTDLGDTTLTDTKSITLAVNPVNDAPTVNVPDAQTIPEDDNLTITDITVGDIDSSNLQVTMTVVNGGLTLSQTTGLNFATGDGTEDSTLTFNGSVEDVNNALSQITYRGNTNFNGSDQIVLTVSDGELEATETIAVTVTAVNDAPIVTVPDSQTVPENTDLNVIGISVNDLDVGNENIEVTLTVSNGVLSLSETTGLNLTTGDGTENTTLTFTGSLANVNNALSQLTYRGNTNFNGNDNISITVRDLGNTGEGGELTDSKVIPITITSVNQPPATDPDKVLAVADDGNAVSLNINPPTDPDGDTLIITVDNIPATDKGTVQLADGTSVTVGQALTVGELEGLQFIPVTGETGIAGNFSYTVDDGQGGTDNQTITFNITPVIVLLEGSSFRVSESQEIIIPNDSSVLSFTYDSLSFDQTNLDFINDAFEAALVDENGNSLVHTIGEGQDSFFNITEDSPAKLAPGVTLDGQTVSVNLAGIEPGTTANLILRLVNDDGDVTTTVRISDIVTETITDLESPQVTPNGISIESNEAINFEGLSDVSNSIQMEYGQTSFNENEQILFAEVTLENVGTYGVNAPLLVAVNNLSDSTVTVVNADGLTPDGLPYFDFSDLVSSGKLAPSELTTSKAISFKNPSGEQFTYELVVLSELNSAPVIESKPNIEVIGGLTYSYDVDAIDADGDSLTYELLVSPEGMSIDTDTGSISWDTTVDDINNHDITIRVSDGRGGVSLQNFTLSVIETPPNRPPIFTTSPVVDAYINQLYVRLVWNKSTIKRA